MKNDITGSDVRCPKCGNGKEDLMKAIEKEEKKIKEII